MGDVGFDAADERARRREERRRRRAEEKEQEEREQARLTQDLVVTSFRSSHSSSGPEIEIKLSSNQSSEEEETSVHSIGSKQLRKTPTRMGKEYSDDKQVLNEAEQKAEEIRLKREREQEERFRERQEERRLALEQGQQNLQELEERRERRRLKQEAEERRLKQEQEERQAREAEDARKLREDIQRRRQEAEERRRNIQNSLNYIRPDYSISDSVLQAEKEKAMTPEEFAVQKEQTLEKRVPPLDISSSTGVEQLRELALKLQAKLVELYEAKFDLLKRKQRQDYDINELTARITDLSKVSAPKKPIVVSVDTGHVSKIKEKGFFVEEKPVKKSFLQERNEGIASSGGVQGRLSMFQTMGRGEDQPDIRRSGRSAWKAPEYDKCCVCNKNVYTLERLEMAKKVYHKQCFKCEYCKKVTSLSDYAMFQGKVYCKLHQRKLERESMQQGGITARH